MYFKYFNRFNHLDLYSPIFGENKELDDYWIKLEDIMTKEYNICKNLCEIEGELVQLSRNFLIILFTREIHKNNNKIIFTIFHQTYKIDQVLYILSL